MAADAFGAWTNGLPTAWVEGPTCDPYVDYNCYAEQSGDGAQVGRSTALAIRMSTTSVSTPISATIRLSAFFRYYELEWGKGVAPADPSAPPGRRSDAVWPPTPQSTPPMPFTEWPYGGTINIGVHPAEFGR